MMTDYRYGERGQMAGIHTECREAENQDSEEALSGSQGKGKCKSHDCTV